jgi:hypothetical protein
MGIAPRVPPLTWLNIFTRLLAIQGSWNYESLLGNGVAFCVEPALRLLPGGVHGTEFKAAMGRQSAYFNARPSPLGHSPERSCPAYRRATSNASARRSPVRSAAWAIG